MPKVKEKKNKKVEDKDSKNILDESNINNSSNSLNINSDNNQKKKKPKVLLFFITLLLITGFLIGILGFNLFNIRDKYLSDTLSQLPIVNNILYPENKEIKENNLDIKKTKFSNINNKEADELISKYEKEIEELKKLNDIQAEQIVNLQEVQKEQAKFKKEKNEFDRMIAEGNKDAFKSFYESMYPENAEALYSEVVKKVSLNKEMKDFINTFEVMDKNKASQTLENMITTDIELVVLILKNISVDQRSSIIASMNPSNASIIIRAIAPQKK